MPDPADAFETWLFRRVAEAVEGAEVSANLLTDLHAAIAEVHARPPEARDSVTLIELAERVNLPVDELAELLATLEAQPTAVRERFRRRFVEAWLIQQREAYDADQHGGNDGYLRGGGKAVPLGGAGTDGASTGEHAEGRITILHAGPLESQERDVPWAVDRAFTADPHQ